MGSDNQLIPRARTQQLCTRRHYGARVWSKLDNPVNVEQKFKEALDDVERMSFASEDDKDTALAAIYAHMQRRVAWQEFIGEYAKVIAYHDAANAVAGVNHGGNQYLKCFAYFKLQHFQEAVEECTHLIDTQRDVSYALYNRARSYEGLKNYLKRSALRTSRLSPRTDPKTTYEMERSSKWSISMRYSANTRSNSKYSRNILLSSTPHAATACEGSGHRV